MRRALLCAVLVSGCSPLRMVPPETDKAALLKLLQAQAAKVADGLRSLQK